MRRFVTRLARFNLRYCEANSPSIGSVANAVDLHPFTTASRFVLSIRTAREALAMSRIAGGVLRFLGIFQNPEVGALVRIHNSARNPLAGHTGRITAVCSADPYGTYLIEFKYGLRFRYQASDFSVVRCSDSVQNPAIISLLIPQPGIISLMRSTFA